MVASGAMAATMSPSKSAGGPLVPKSLNSVAWKIVRECTNSSMSKYEKAVALYDWLIDHTVYRGSTTNPYHVLRYGEASCGGYASAYRDLLAKVGIPSKTIDGRLYTLRHTWNLVYLNGKWCHVDVRMGDHLAESEGRYRRFGMSDEQGARVLQLQEKEKRQRLFQLLCLSEAGQLDSAIAYVRSAITTRVGAGAKLFVIDLTAMRRAERA